MDSMSGPGKKAAVSPQHPLLTKSNTVPKGKGIIFQDRAPVSQTGVMKGGFGADRQ